MKISVLVPGVSTRPDLALGLSGIVRFGGAERLWQGHSLALDTNQQFAYLAGAGIRIPVGYGVTLMPLQHPYHAAAQARSLAMLMGQPVVTAVGVGGRGFQQSLLGRPYRSPLTAAREYLSTMRQLLAGQSVGLHGEYVHCEATLGAIPQTDSGAVELGVGVLRPGLARLAGEVADVAVSWLTPASYLRDVIRPALQEGACRANRPVPRLAAVIPMARSKVGRDPRAVVLRSSAGHLALPHYRDMLTRAGASLDGTAVGDSDQLLSCGAFLYGELDEITIAAKEFAAAGVDELIINCVGVAASEGAPAALDEIGELTEELTR